MMSADTTLGAAPRVTPRNASTLSVMVTQTQTGASFPCVVEVAIEGAQSTTLVPVKFDFEDTSDSVAVDVPFTDTYLRYSADPRHRLVNVEATAALTKPDIYWF